MPRAVRTAQTLSTAPDTTGHTPGVTGARAASIRTRRVEITGQEVGQASEADRETPSVIGSARAMATESREMGDDAGWMAHRADHAATRHESERSRWLQTKRVSTDGASAGLRAYLSHPHHFPSTTDHPPTIQTHRVVVDDSSHNLEESVTTGGPTRPLGRVEAESVESNAPDMSYMDHRCRRSDPEAPYAKTRPLEPIEDGPRALGQRDH